LDETFLQLKAKDVWYAVSVFHAYAHEASCQCLYHPRKREGFGLTDGEWLERLWSYLERFTKTTRIMTPSHRKLILSLALDHFAETRIQKIGNYLYFYIYIIYIYSILNFNNFL